MGRRAGGHEKAEPPAGGSVTTTRKPSQRHLKRRRIRREWQLFLLASASLSKANARRILAPVAPASEADVSEPNQPVPLAAAVLTVSDTRTEADDRSGAYLVEALAAAGHRLSDRRLVPDDRYQVRAAVSGWIADPDVQLVLATGGTGLGARDGTPEAVLPLLDTRVEGFGELFRSLSYADVGTSTLQSRALAGLANATVVVCLPGSTGACRTAWEGILREQLDVRHRPCNLGELVVGQ